MEASRRQCWICLEEECASTTNSPSVDRWIHPCRCKGTTGWVHEACLLAWLNSRLSTLSNREAQHAGGPLTASTPLACPQCRTPYCVVEGGSWVPPVLLRAVDRALEARDGLVFVAMLEAIVGAVWVASWAYGALTVFLVLGPTDAAAFFLHHGKPLYRLAQVIVGHDDGSNATLTASEVIRAWWKAVLGVSMIPVALIGQHLHRHLPLYLAPLFLLDGLFSPPGSTQHFQDLLAAPALPLLALPYIQRGYGGLRRRLFARFLPDSVASSSSSFISLPSDSLVLDEDAEDEAMISIAERSVTSLLLFPAAASLLGWGLFRNTRLRGLHRSLLAGAILTVASDFGRLLYRYQAASTKQSRRILERPITPAPRGIPSIL